MQLDSMDILLLDLLIIAILGWRIIKRDTPITETLYWLAIITLIPVFGGILFVVLNEKPLGRKRLRRLNKFMQISKDWEKIKSDLSTQSFRLTKDNTLASNYAGAAKHLSHNGEFPAVVGQ